MSNILTKSILAVSAFVAIAGAIVPAAASAGEVSNRIANEQARINGGVRDGQLTFGEFANTESRLHRINAQRDFWLRTQGGHLSHYQYFVLNRELNGDSASIFFDKHNWARQPGAPLR